MPNARAEAQAAVMRYNRGITIASTTHATRRGVSPQAAAPLEDISGGLDSGPEEEIGEEGRRQQRARNQTAAQQEPVNQPEQRRQRDEHLVDGSRNHREQAYNLARRPAIPWQVEMDLFGDSGQEEEVGEESWRQIWRQQIAAEQQRQRDEHSVNETTDRVQQATLQAERPQHAGNQPMSSSAAQTPQPQPNTQAEAQGNEEIQQQQRPDPRLNDREQRLNDRERLLTEREAALERHHQARTRDFNARERDLARRERELTNRQNHHDYRVRNGIPHWLTDD
ncbi:MAG: hypothetical protein Q9209_000042 [Squamulea sp. 1 TL-2023]